jgi:hypothetical protein
MHDIEGAEEWLQNVHGFALADRNYWRPELMERLKTKGRAAGWLGLCAFF